MIKQFHFLLYTEENKNKNLKKTHAQQRSHQHYIQQPIHGNKLSPSKDEQIRKTLDTHTYTHTQRYITIT